MSVKLASAIFVFTLVAFMIFANMLEKKARILSAQEASFLYKPCYIITEEIG